MYLKKIRLENIKCFTDLELNFTSDGPGNPIRKWTAILGQNGLGKSTLLQAIGAVLAGPGAIRELLPVAEGWVRSEHPFGMIEAELVWTEGDAQTQHWPKTKTPYTARYAVSGENPSVLPQSLAEYTVPVITDWAGEGNPRERERISKDMSRLKQTAYAEGKQGWFACGYGPFRRLSGGAQAADRILYSGRKSARFITLFREDAALTNAAEWLISLYNTAKDGIETNERGLIQVKNAFTQDLLPLPAELIVNSQSALLKINDQKPVPFRDLSDGYRSMLALGIDLLRWAGAAFPDADDLTKVPGVVLIDELDAHAHPAWQRQIGHWLRKKFPNIQFIITTHSPFLAQVADEPGGNIVLEQATEGVQKREDVEFVETWRVDQILTDLLELRTTRSPEVENKIERLKSLSQRKLQLSSLEKQEYSQLMIWAENLTPAIEDPLERRLASTLQAAVNKSEKQIKALQ